MLSVEQGAESVLRFARASGTDARRCAGEVLDQLTNERMVVAYSLFDEESGARVAPRQALIGKCYNDDTGVRAFRAMRALTQALAGLPEAPLLAVPEALFY